DTHAAPLRIEATISDIRLSAAEEMFADPEAINRMAAGIGADLRSGVIALAVRALVAATVGAVVVGLLLFRSVRRALASGATSLLAIVPAGSVAYTSFNPGAIAEPRYTGLIAGAPQVVGSAEEVVGRFSQYQERLAGLARHVGMVDAATSALP